MYLPNAQTELSFRQALGRVVRSAGKDDDSSAYGYAYTIYLRSFEREMKLIEIKDKSKNKNLS